MYGVLVVLVVGPMASSVFVGHSLPLALLPCAGTSLRAQVCVSKIVRPIMAISLCVCVRVCVCACVYVYSLVQPGERYTVLSVVTCSPRSVFHNRWTSFPFSDVWFEVSIICAL